MMSFIGTVKRVHPHESRDGVTVVWVRRFDGEPPLRCEASGTLPTVTAGARVACEGGQRGDGVVLLDAVHVFPPCVGKIRGKLHHKRSKRGAPRRQARQQREMFR